MTRTARIASPDAGRLRVFLAVMVALALSVAPFSFGFGVHAAQASAHTVTGSHHGHDNGAKPDGGGTLNHIVTHCGAQLCAPPYVDARPAIAVAPVAWARIASTPDLGKTPRSFCLDSDPPVPRPGLS